MTITKLDSWLMPTYNPPAVRFMRGEGPYLWDDQGNRYLDFLCGLAVTSLGHAHPAVSAAIADQATRLMHVSNLFGSEHNSSVAETIDRLIGDGESVGGQVFFCNSGAEANEAAIKLARRHGAGRHVILSANGSFHGRTMGALAATGQPSKWEGFQPLPAGFKQVVWNDLDDFEKNISDDVVAVLLEPVQGEGGVNPATVEYFQGVERLCRQHDILFMIDEIQIGLARSGRWFGFQHFGVNPDVVTLAKALGNGMPIGACWAKPKVAGSFRPGDHGTTYGGQPLATAAARAVLGTLEAIEAPRLVAQLGQALREGFSTLEKVSEIRGLGLLVALELDGVDAKAVASKCLERGLVVNAVSATAVRLAPPFVIDQTHIDEAVATLTGVLKEV